MGAPPYTADISMWLSAPSMEASSSGAREICEGAARYTPGFSVRRKSRMFSFRSVFLYIPSETGSMMTSTTACVQIMP